MALDDGRVVSNFVAQALLGQSLTIYGNGQQTRSFQYVSDLINGMVKMMDSKSQLPYSPDSSDERLSFTRLRERPS
jgi:UDP-glucuronate decarboxylase